MIKHKVQDALMTDGPFIDQVNKNYFQSAGEASFWGNVGQAAFICYA